MKRRWSYVALKNNISEENDASCMSSMTIAVYVSVSVLWSFNNNVLHHIWSEKVLMRCLLLFTYSTLEYYPHEYYTSNCN